jgi:flagellar protein FlgJ
MYVDPLAAGPAPELLHRSSNPEEAARSFEQVLVRQFVKTLTDSLFQTSLDGEEGPGWMKAHADTQRAVLTDILTEQFVEQKTFGLADLLLAQWKEPAGLIP